MSEPTHPNGPQASGTTDDPIHVKSDTIPVGLVIRLFLLGWALAVLIPLGVVLALRWHDQDARVANVEDVATRNRALVRENFRLQTQLKTFVADQCIAAESRDVVTVQANNAMITLLNRLVPPSADVPAETRDALADYKQALRDANATLEPEGEQDCQPGPEGEKP